MFAGKTAVSQIKRELPSLVEYLYRESTFPVGCFLMTGTGIVPPDLFTLAGGDEISITIEPIGTFGQHGRIACGVGDVINVSELHRQRNIGGR